MENSVSITVVRAFFKEKPDNVYIQPCRDTDCFVYYLSGGHKFEFAQNSFSVSAGKLLFLPKGAKYKNIKLDADTKYYQVEFDFSFCCEESVFSSPKVFDGDEQLLLLISSAYKSFCFSKDVFSASANVLNMISQLKKSSDNKTVSMLGLDKIAPTVEYLAENFASNDSLEYLASLSLMSKSNLEKTFMQVFSLSPVAYRNSLRIDRAKILLASGFSASEVAYRTGFSDVFYFSRIFKKFAKISPGEFAKLNKG